MLVIGCIFLYGTCFLTGSPGKGDRKEAAPGLGDRLFRFIPDSLPDCAAIRGPQSQIPSGIGRR
jgi:hypothetical protein